MFNWIKKWFCKPQEQTVTVCHLVYEIEVEPTVKPKRKYTKHKKIKIKTKGRKK